MQKSEQVGKTGDNALNELVHFVQRFEQRPTLDNLRLVNRYVEGKFHFALQFHDARFDIDCIAYFQRFDRTAEIGTGNELKDSTRITPFADCGTHPPIIEFGGGSILEPHGSGEQKPVLVHIVQSSELPEPIIPSLVWFQSVDAFNCIAGGLLYFSTSLGRHVIIEALTEREKDVLFGCSERTDDDDSVCHVVESRPKVLQNVSSDYGDHLWNFRNRNDLENMISGFRINLAAQEIAVFLVEGVECDLQLTDVLIGPFDF